MNKKVVYTCLVGAYDILEEPHIRDGWDYICFSNDYVASPESIWTILPIPSEYDDNVILSRYAKLLPHRVLSDFEYSVYIDANLSIVNELFFDQIDKLIQSNTTIAIAKHTQRTCIYQEIEACYKLSKESYKNLSNWHKYLKGEQYPDKNGLHENNIIFRRHNDLRLIEMNEYWMLIFTKFVKRDQLSLEFVAWKYNIPIKPLFYEGFNSRNCDFLKFSLHKENFIQKLQRKYRENRNQFIFFIRRGLK
ncbi:glycosyltransferase domain-containing protein [Saccharicrinis aurantiacus]|uniref:glycosyltransferase domain-containing protein n=1 Tax=Saccharicrinis aurantiacus TaxID=1849719 RepID=UPI0009500C5C|nr:glycosyltransferase domain-containing protein [Saccharicrinis aurantiacus]